MHKTPLFILLVCFFVYTVYITHSRVRDSNIHIRTYYCFDVNLSLDQNTENVANVFKSSGLVPVKHYTQADILFTNTHDQFMKLDGIGRSERCKYIYGLRSVNLFASKSALAFIMSKDVIPKTWILNNTDHVADLLTHFDTNTQQPTVPMLLKSNLQRQSGLKFVEKLSDIENGLHKYVVCQEILKNPLLVNGMKVDIRVYLLIVCAEQQFAFYIYRDGFVYYTGKKFDADSVSYDTVVSSGYIDRKVYETNPLTTKDLYEFLGTEKANTLQNSIRGCFTKVARAYKPLLKKNDLNDGTNRFILMGADVSPNEDCEVKLLEINKGPDLKTKDVRDKEVKETLTRETLNILRNPAKTNSFFTKIL